MTPIARINIFEHRIGEAPEGYWKYFYDAYPQGKPVEEGAEAQGRAAFSAYRTQAPGTVPIYLHRYNYLNPGDGPMSHLQPNERTPSSYELDEHSSTAPGKAPSGSVDKSGIWVEYKDSAPMQSGDSTRAFWAFPASFKVDGTDVVAVYEHRLEVDFLTDPAPISFPPKWKLIGRCAAYIRYSPSESAGRVFEGSLDARVPSPPMDAWWRTKMVVASNGRMEDTLVYAYARYRRKIAFHAFRPQ